MTKTPYNFVSDERFDQLGTWLIKQGYNIHGLTPMSADAGFRRYFRLQIDERTLVAVDAPPKYEDMQSFILVAQKLQTSGLVTPVIHCYNLENGFMLLSDLGSLHLQDIATPKDSNSAQPLYNKALLALIKMQANTPTDGLPSYSADFLMQELMLFPQWYLQKHLKYNCPEAITKQLQDCFDLCIESAREQPRVFVHRDYHCRNLMIQPGNDIAIIDFQGAMAGPITYDLVSLLRDAYVEWTESFIGPLIESHYHSMQTTLSSSATWTGVTRDTHRKWFDLMGLQRHLKILGIFCRLHYRDGKSHYLNNISLVRKHVLAVCQKYPELTSLHDLLMQLPQSAIGGSSE